MENIPDRAWVEINLDHIAGNLREIKKRLGSGVMINGVVKADGYGHGAVMAAEVLCENGIDMLSVATLDEAVQLRKQKVNTPILILGYTDVGLLKDIIRNDAIITVFDWNIAKKFSDEAAGQGKKVKAHLKIDTGMNRIGFHHSDVDAIINAYALEGLDIIGTFTHFSTADEVDSKYTDLQFSRFMDILGILREKGIDPGICHADNSGGTVFHCDKALDMVRAGLMLYGLYPSGDARDASDMDLKSAMTLKAKIIKIKTVPAGVPVSYGNRFVTKRETRIATISCGYADGYSRALSGKTSVMIAGKKVPVIGNICMDMCMADITDISESVVTGDDAVLFDGVTTADEIAALSGTINYEIVCRIGIRVPRVYIKDGKIVKISNYLLRI